MTGTRLWLLRGGWKRHTVGVETAKVIVAVDRQREERAVVAVVGSGVAGCYQRDEWETRSGSVARCWGNIPSIRIRDDPCSSWSGNRPGSTGARSDVVGYMGDVIVLEQRASAAGPLPYFLPVSYLFYALRPDLKALCSSTEIAAGVNRP